MLEHQSASNEAILQAFKDLPAILRVKLDALIASGMDSVAAFDSLSEEEQQLIERAAEKVI